MIGKVTLREVLEGQCVHESVEGHPSVVANQSQPAIGVHGRAASRWVEPGQGQ